MVGPLSFRMLGPLDVTTADGRRVELGGPRPQLVLARLLLAEGRVVSVDALLEALWGADLPSTAAGTLQAYVSRLRRALGPDGGRLLRREFAGYLLDVGEDAVDARRFERLAARGGRLLAAGEPAEAAEVLSQAVQLWRGDLLGGVDTDFVRSAAVHWHERRAAAEEDYYDAELQSGRAAAAVAGLTDAVSRAPLRERLLGLLALALYRAGRQADALASLDAARRRFGEELGLDLSRDLRALQARILDQDPTLDLPAPASAPRTPAQEETLPAETLPEETLPAETLPEETLPDDSLPDELMHVQPVQPALERATGELIGRDAELHTVLNVVREVLAEQSCRYVLIEGQPGMGKTRLAQELVRDAALLGATALSATTLEIGVSPAYGPWRQLLQAARSRVGELPDAAGRLLHAVEHAPPGTTPAVVAGALAETVAETLLALAGTTGLVVVLDDLQWADPASLDLLVSLGPRLASAPVLLAATVRDLDVGRDDAVAEALAQITRSPGTRRLTLRGLSLEESGRLLTQAAGQAVATEVVAAVHARSEGNPFFTTELARMIIEEGAVESAAAGTASVPSGVRDVLQRRVSRLPKSTRELLQVAAVLGRQVDVELVARVADRPLLDCLDDLEPALVARLLEIPASSPRSLRFTHALVREALADGLTSLRRARLHLRAADGLLETAGDTDDTAEIVADHLWKAAAVGAGDRAAAALERAAQVALKRQALVSAESLLSRAAQLYRATGAEGGLAELRVLRQMFFVGAALHGYAVNSDSKLVRRARELARTTNRPDILLDLIWADWAGCDTGGQPLRGEQLVIEAESLFAGTEDPLLLGGLESMRGFTERHFGRMASAHEHITRAIAHFRAAGESQDAGFYLNGYLTSQGFRHWATALLGTLDREELERDYLSQHLPFGRIVMGLFGAAATLAVGDQAGLRTFAERMTAADPDMLLSFWSSAAELYSAVSLLQRGQVAAGLELLQRGREHMSQGGGRTMQAGVLAGAAQALATAGAAADARRVVDDARAELGVTWELAYEPFVDLAEAHVYAVEGDADAAERCVDRAMAVATEHGSLGVAARIERERLTLGRQRDLEADRSS